MRRIFWIFAFVMMIDPANACRSLPPSSERGGVHWSYRVDRDSGRHCWYPDGHRQTSRHVKRTEERKSPIEKPRPEPQPDKTDYAIVKNTAPNMVAPEIDRTTLGPPFELAKIMLASADLNVSGTFRDDELPDDGVWPTLPKETADDPDDEILLTSIWPALPPPERNHLPTMAIALIGIFGAAAALWRTMHKSAWCAEWGPQQPLWRLQGPVDFFGCGRKYSRAAP